MGSLLSPHWIPQHYSDNDRAVLKQWNPKAIKIVWNGVPAHLDAALEANPELIVVRDHALSEQKDGDPRLLGIAHAKAIKQTADAIKAQYPQADMNRFAHEGINEPELWARHPAAWVVEYERARLAVMHTDGLRAVVGNLNTGWPADYGVKDSPPNWEPWKPLFAAMNARDFLGLHEYFPLAGPEEGWLWNAGRYLQCPYSGPILITELGLDNAVRTGEHLGWTGLDGSLDARAAQYTSQLLRYADAIARDKRVYAACIFTHDSQSAHWISFDTRNDVFLRYFLPALAAWKPAKTWGDDRTHRWAWLVEKHAARVGLDPRIPATVLALESAGRVDAVSSAGAVGLMQVMPHEAIPGRPRAYMLKNPELNVTWGCNILRSGIDSFGGSLAHGLASYYMGSGGLAKKGIQHPDAQHYINTFARVWRELWPGVALPGNVGPVNPGEPPPPAPLPPANEVCYHAEEAAREARDGKGQQAHDRIVRWVLPTLYALRDGKP